MKEPRFEGKVALVTGGSSGIGLATASLLSRSGAHIWLVARSKPRLESALAAIETTRRIPGQKYGFSSADVVDAEQAAPVIDACTASIGPPDILINSAGDVHPAVFHEMDLDIARRLMGVNYFGTINMTRACLPAMISRRSGHIVNMASVYGFIGGYGYSAYSASKYAVHGFSDSLRAELKPLGVKVSVVFPQNTSTPQLEREKRLQSAVMKALDNTKTMSADDVARSIIKGIISHRYLIIPGAEGRFLFWLTGWLRTGTYLIMDRLVASACKKAAKGA